LDSVIFIVLILIVSALFRPQLILFFNPVS